MLVGTLTVQPRCIVDIVVALMIRLLRYDVLGKCECAAELGDLRAGIGAK